MTIEEYADAIVTLLEDKKAADVVKLHVADKTVVADYFVICSGRSAPHIKALCDEVQDKAKELGLPLLRTDGYTGGRWIVMDFASILVHIFHPEERAYYNMERLWTNE